jgi:alanine racemase
MTKPITQPYATWLEINLAAVERNVQYIIRSTGTPFMAVLKGNAYGHGSVEVGKAALKGGAVWLAVARVDEALVLRNAGISAPILVLGVPPYAQVDAAIANTLTLPLASFEAADVYSQRAKALGRPLQVHLKVDTGMGRLGVLPEEILPLAKKARDLGDLDVNGLFSHFANADAQQHPLMDVQMKNFQAALTSLEEAGMRPRWAHLSNSPALFSYPAARFDMTRGAEALLGLNSFEYRSLPDEVQPVLTAWKTRLVSCKTVPDGWSIGYGSTYTTHGNELIGVISAGFGDGIRRLPGNEVLIDGQRVPVVGATCMDVVMVKLPKPYPLDTEVVILGTSGKETITAIDIASRYNTVHVDLLTSITARVPRVYYWD